MERGVVIVKLMMPKTIQKTLPGSRDRSRNYYSTRLYCSTAAYSFNGLETATFGSFVLLVVYPELSSRLGFYRKIECDKRCKQYVTTVVVFSTFPLMYASVYKICLYRFIIKLFLQSYISTVPCKTVLV